MGPCPANGRSLLASVAEDAKTDRLLGAYQLEEIALERADVELAGAVEAKGCDGADHTQLVGPFRHIAGSAVAVAQRA